MYIFVNSHVLRTYSTHIWKCSLVLNCLTCRNVNFGQQFFFNRVSFGMKPSLIPQQTKGFSLLSFLSLCFVFCRRLFESCLVVTARLWRLKTCRKWDVLLFCVLCQRNKNDAFWLQGAETYVQFLNGNEHSTVGCLCKKPVSYERIFSFYLFFLCTWMFLFLSFDDWLYLRQQIFQCASISTTSSSVLDTWKIALRTNKVCLSGVVCSCFHKNDQD